MKKAYTHYVERENRMEMISFEDWKTSRIASSPQLQYWSITLDFELAVLIFVQSIRCGNFALYKDALSKIIPWFFALDHTNYARWLPVHLHDVMQLAMKHPNLESKFEAGHFVVHETQCVHSGIAIDHAHEQNNKCVKGDGGAVGLTENSSELLRWMTAGPEIARIIAEFEISKDIRSSKTKRTDTLHPEQFRSAQSKFEQQVHALCDTMEKMGNPFTEDSTDLLVLDSGDIADPEVIESICKVEKLGQEQFNNFVETRLEKTTSLFSPVTKNKLQLFRNQKKTAQKKNCKLSHWKRCALCLLSCMCPVLYRVEIWMKFFVTKTCHIHHHCPSLVSSDKVQSLTLSTVWRKTCHPPLVTTSQTWQQYCLMVL